MEQDAIAAIGIDEAGRLYVVPRSRSFPYIYREAMEIGWDATGRCLHAPPPPRAQLETPAWWFRRILAAAKEQGCLLQTDSQTTWINVPPELREPISAALADNNSRNST